ncbi:hypothetical protein KSP40_PGU013768 [Platanthera guangdongensis]|uniref:Uncharacterized protein n=1 Tax=Platanthera guangdongensis TaxID=2320717 RepID=A0ABR2LTL6_9ASPA
MAPSVAAAADEWQDGACRTPTAAECRIPDPTTCPPAPRKLRSGGGGGQTNIRWSPETAKEFFLPAAADLEKIFNAHRVVRGI